MKFKKLLIYPTSLLGAAGTGLQNYIAMVAACKAILNGVLAASKTGLAFIHSLSIVLGGVCSTLINFCINIGLLEDFIERISHKPSPHLSTWQKFKYWLGCAIFISTGILFGLTTLAFGSTSFLAIISIIAGIGVAFIMAIQELETWLASFDDLEENKKNIKQRLLEWWNSLTVKKTIGLLASIGNVIGLSLLFTIGLSSFFISIGIAAFPATIASFTIAFTGGAFTEFFFYNHFIGKFCENFKAKWCMLQEAKYPSIGLACGIINAIVNGALGYASIIFITQLLVTASIAVPPIGLIIALAATTSTCMAAASFILGMDFWIANSNKLTGYFSNDSKVPETNKPGIYTDNIMKQLANTSTKPNINLAATNDQQKCNNKFFNQQKDQKWIKETVNLQADYATKLLSPETATPLSIVINP